MLARITSIGGDLYHVHVMEGGNERPDQGLPHPGRPVDPGWGRPGFGGRPVDPDYGHEIGHRPDQGLPGGGEHPGHLPGLPPGPPPQVRPGEVLIAVRDQHGTWYFAAMPAGSVPPKPDQGLPPGSPGAPDQGLPGQPPHVGNRPPGSGMPPRPDQGLPRPPFPGAPPQPGQGLPPGSPGAPDQGLPPTAQPR